MDRNRNRWLIAAGVWLIALVTPVAAEVGGGFADAGIQAEYYPNESLSGAPTFVRREVRVDFDWGTVLPIGGSNGAGFHSFPTDAFSVRFSGRLLPAFSETYTFRVVADDGARLWIRPSGSPTWISLIDQWTTPGSYTANQSLLRGTTYDLRLEYREGTGDARVRLLWSSPSTPEEVIDPAVEQGFNITFMGQVFADITKCGRNTWLGVDGNPPPAQDANGWPQGDAGLVFQESLNQGLDIDPLMLGHVTFSFQGRADVTLNGNANWNTLVSSYDAPTNTKSGTFDTWMIGWNASYITLSNTDRDGQQPPRHNGFTNLRLMRPTEPDSTTSYPPDVLITDQARRACAKFTALRVNLNNANQERFWSDRTLPTFFNQASGKLTSTTFDLDGSYATAPYETSNGISWEYAVMLANETGSDLYINLPVMADGWSPADTSSYVFKLARLLRFGSDGVEPYAAPTPNPAYPPLNPNLRVYVEHCNEVWNFFGLAFRQFFDEEALVRLDVRAALGDPVALADPLARPGDYPALNYDGLSTATGGNGDFDGGILNTWRQRKQILRVIQVSDIFRSVWGDAAMHTRIRPLYEWQYGNLNGTAQVPLRFADDWFANGNGNANVPTPHPVNHFIWGGGGATYYGAANGYGTTDQLSNPSFEVPAVGSGYSTAPAGAGWTFTGTAGIARDAGAGDDIPPAFDGRQVGFIAGTGAVEAPVTIPATQTSNTYAFVFRALQRLKAGAGSPDTQRLRVFIDGVESNWHSFNQSNGYQPLPYDPANPWSAFVVFWAPGTPYYSSTTFTASPGQVVTLRIEGTAAADQAAFLEDVRLCSVDAIFASGMPGGGEANGQPAGSAYQGDLNTQGAWAAAYGLRQVSYEGGWSLGGDTGGTPLQNTAKFRSPEARDANIRAIDMFHQSGGRLNTFGTYSLWPSWAEDLAEEGLVDVDLYPLVQAMDDRYDHLPADPANGVIIPNRLLATNATLRDGLAVGGNMSPRGWGSWNVLSPVTADFNTTLSTQAGGSVVLSVDGVPVAPALVTGGAAGFTLHLTRGLHGVRIRSASATPFSFDSIDFTIPGTPAKPVITGITDTGGALDVHWDPVPGATHYTLRWGADSGLYTSSLDTGSATSHVVTGLAHNTTYYFVVVASNAVGPSLPSDEVGSTPLVDGLAGTLARWDFAGRLGGEATVVPSANTSRLVVTPVSRGPGMGLSTYGTDVTADSFAYMPVSDWSSPSFQDAFDHGLYTEFSLTPKPGQSVSIDSVSFSPYWQNETGPGGAIAWRVGSGTFTIVPTTGTPTVYVGSPLAADLSAVTALHGATEPITIRLVHAGIPRWEYAGIGRHAGDDVVVLGSVTSVGGGGGWMVR